MQLIDRPHLAPMGCAICGSPIGPLLDTMHELGPDQLRIYFCRAHLKEIAAAGGYVKDDVPDELLRGAERLTAKTREFEALRSDFGAVLDRCELLEQQVRDQAGRASTAEQRAEQLQQQLDSVVASMTATANATRLVTVPAEEDDEPALD